MGERKEKKWKIIAITFIVLFLISSSFLWSYISKQDEQFEEKTSSLTESELDEKYETECKYDICGYPNMLSNLYEYNKSENTCYCYAYDTGNYGDFNYHLIYKKYME